MDSYFFKPVKPPKKNMDDALTPDDAPAGSVPQAVFFFSILPKFVQHIISAFVHVFYKLFSALGDIIWQSMRADDKAKKTSGLSAPKETYSTHASFDHLNRIDKIEHELAGMRGGSHVVNKYFKPNVELRLRRLETHVGLRPPN